MKLFDLNIEEVLENWTCSDAVRELIANALDEQVISQSKPIQIYKDGRGLWHIRDFGRGLQIQHFTMNENPEKLAREEGVIGRFGVGLKDALATLHRHGVKISIQSANGIFGLAEAPKESFAAITTLHVEWYEERTSFEGTEITLADIPDDDIDNARRRFLAFSPERLVEETIHGEILTREAPTARVFINGVAVADEQNFLFSYNIVRLSGAMKRALNRERQNAGRSLYADRVKSILKAAVSADVQSALCTETQGRAAGSQCDEMQWIDVSQHALSLYSRMREREYEEERARLAANPSAGPALARRVAFLTETEVKAQPDVVDNMNRDRVEVVVVSDAQKRKLEKPESGAKPVRTIEAYRREYNESFQYRFVEEADLNDSERRVFSTASTLISLIGVSAESVPRIRISETLRPFSEDAGGVWDPQNRTIVIRRAELQDEKLFGGVLLHELAHALSGTPDVSRAFERRLTDYLGILACAYLKASRVAVLAVGTNGVSREGQTSIWDWLRRR